jgi:nanoRNase/pAp phosphatase (c-di-AMP/oligoRNAs hydrolase)
MVSRLVLGCGSVGRAVVGTADERSDRTLVLCADEDRVETLRSSSVAAKRADPTDAATLAALDRPVDVIVVAADDAATNRAAAEVAREHYPDAFVLAYTGEDAADGARAAIEAAADRVIAPETATAEQLLDRIGEETMRPRRLWALLQELTEPLAILTHDNPDPDAIASGVALREIAAAAGCEADVCHFGRVTHEENRAMINLLDLDLHTLTSPEAVDEYGGIALVDHSRPGVNDQLPPDAAIDVVIDHHPPRAPVEARFVDLRSDVGATSTLLSSYLRRLDIPVGAAVANGLLYGIRVDTKEFSREVSTADFEAAAFLLPAAEVDVLERIESPSVSAETLGTLASAIGNRRVEGTVLTSCVGELGERDALAQAADQLLDIEGVTTTVVYGILDGAVYLSGRTRGAGLDLGEVLRDAFDPIGSAGGHADMAGAQIPLGLLGDADDGESLTGIVSDVIDDRFFEALASLPGARAPADASVASPVDAPGGDDSER